MKKAFWVLVGLAAALASCSPATSSNTATTAPTGAKFAVLSDTHYFPTSMMGTNSTAFAAYLAADRKMIAESGELLDVVLADLKKKSLDFVLISGDLTKDGEKTGHQELAARLKALGTKVLVIPGNHDVNNPVAYDYSTSAAASYVTPAEFKTIYADCGYATAVAQDPDSLSYISEPVAGLWVFAIDSCKYTDNVANGSPTTSGAIGTATLAWIKAQLVKAQAQGKTVIGMMHHGLVEHFTGQGTLFSEYVVDDWKTVSKELSDEGLNLVFTGHFHANDIAERDFTTSVLHDVETGSLVTAPSPYRLVSLDFATKAVTVTSSLVTAIASHPTDFVAYSQQYLYDGLGTANTGLVPQMLMAPVAYGGFGLDAATANAMAPLISYAMMTHYYGEESGLTNTASAANVVVGTYPLATAAAATWASLTDTSDPGSTYRNLIGAIWTDSLSGDATTTSRTFLLK